MAVNYGQRLGFKDSDLVLALLISNFIGFPATFLYGFFTHYLGAKKGLYLALFAYIGVCLWAIQMTEMREFYILSFIIGLFQGASQGLSRSIYATLIPANHSSEFFGFYSMVTKFANVIGPALVAIAATISNDPKWVLLSLIPMFVIGSILLSFVEVSNKHSN
jgi:UMF1 family MFS transporter